MPLAVSNRQTPDSSVVSMKELISHNRKPRAELLQAEAVSALPPSMGRLHIGTRTH